MRPLHKQRALAEDGENHLLKRELPEILFKKLQLGGEGGIIPEERNFRSSKLKKSGVIVKKKKKNPNQIQY